MLLLNYKCNFIFAFNRMDIEVLIQKHLISFCKILPIHVEKWHTSLQELKKPVHALTNYAEQLRYIERANITYLENFSELQEKLMYKIYNEIEDEIRILKVFIDQLNQSNHELKNKLTLLEKSTIDLNWESDSSLIRGNAIQPPLSRILSDGLDFWTYFSNAMKTINDHVKHLNVLNEKSMTSFERSFILNLEDPCVRILLAIVQYVDNEKSIT